MEMKDMDRETGVEKRKRGIEKDKDGMKKRNEKYREG